MRSCRQSARRGRRTRQARRSEPDWRSAPRKRTFASDVFGIGVIRVSAFNFENLSSFRRDAEVRAGLAVTPETSVLPRKEHSRLPRRSLVRRRVYSRAFAVKCLVEGKPASGAVALQLSPTRSLFVQPVRDK